MYADKRSREFYILAFFFAIFVLFLYGPLSAIVILSFQGENGGLTFPLNGVSLHWFANLLETQAVGDFGGSFRRSAALGLMVMAVTVLVSLLAGLAFRRALGLRSAGCHLGGGPRHGRRLCGRHRPRQRPGLESG